MSEKEKDTLLGEEESAADKTAEEKDGDLSAANGSAPEDTGDKESSSTSDDGDESAISGDTDDSDNKEEHAVSRPTGSNTEKSANADDLKKGRTIIIAELALAAIAIIIIVVSIALKKSNEKNEPSVSNDIAVSENEIDNSILFTDIPEIPKFEKDSSIDYEGLEAEGKMLKLSGEDGSDIYVHNYTNREYFLSETSISENDVEETVRSQILFNYLESVPVSRDTCELYDTVSINYAGKIDGVAFDGGTAEDQIITLGVDPFIEGFTEGIIGMKVGETKDVLTRFPDSYPGGEELEGKEAVFTITLNSIEHGNKVPELTDELATEASEGQFTTAKEAREYIEKQLRAVKIWAFIDSDFYVANVPEDIVLTYYKRTMEQYDKNSKQSGYSVEDMVSLYYGVNMDEFKKETISTAAESVQHATLYNAIAKKEGVTVSDEDIAKLAADYGYSEDQIDAFKEEYTEEIIKDYILQSNLMDYFMTIK